MKNVYRGSIPPNMAEAHMGSDVGPGLEGGERTNGLRRDASVQSASIGQTQLRASEERDAY